MLTEDQGTEAIIDLQDVAGIKEDENQARENWKKFSMFAKKQTKAAHEVMCGGFDSDGNSNYEREL